MGRLVVLHRPENARGAACCCRRPGPIRPRHGQEFPSVSTRRPATPAWWSRCRAASIWSGHGGAAQKEQGYDVVGITLQLYDHGAAVGRTGACCAGQDIQDARQVAERLAIPHYVLDYESRFRAEVMDSFADSYVRGETPVPCIACNRTVKFRDLLQDGARAGRRGAGDRPLRAARDGRGGA